MSRYVDIHTHRPTGRHIEPSGAGIHPWDAADIDAGTLELPDDADVIGEIGLDKLRGPASERQQQVLRRQLEIACELDKPVILHCVRAFEELMRILGDYPLRAVIFHGFIGSGEQAQRALGRGYFLSFGERSFRSPKSVGVLRTMPLSNLFLETDDADIAIEEVYSAAAEVRGMTVGDLQTAIMDNYERVFHILK